MTIEETCVPNHHAHFPTFGGVTGLVAAATMVPDREGDARLAARLSGLLPGESVVDIGCGPGTAARHAARRGATVTGIDPASVMLRVARLLTRPSRAVRYLEGSAERIPLPDRAVSVAWAIASVHHWSDLNGGLREARRVLAPGGRLVALERRAVPGARGHASHGWTEAQAGAFADRCLQLGFTNAGVDEHPTGRRTTLSVTVTVP